jgi:autotransporter-associated beta strand protein
MTINVDNTKTVTINGAVSGTGKLLKTGKGTLALGSDNTFGALQINDGTVAASKDSNLGDPNLTIQLRENGRLRATDTFTMTRPITVLGIDTEGIEVDAGKKLTINKGITGNGKLFKYGTGTLICDKNSTSSVSVGFVMSGKLQIDGQFTTGEGLFNQSGALVGGKGRVRGKFNNRGRVNPGGDPGTMTFEDDVELEAGSFTEIDINSAIGLPGETDGWGLMHVEGVLNLLGPSVLELVSYDSLGNPGPMSPALFNPFESYSWEFARADGGILGFSPGLITVDSVGFLNAVPAGSQFSVAMREDRLILDYSPVPEPAGFLLAAIALGALLPRARISRAASN